MANDAWIGEIPPASLPPPPPPPASRGPADGLSDSQGDVLGESRRGRLSVQPPLVSDTHTNTLLLLTTTRTRPTKLQEEEAPLTATYTGHLQGGH